MPQAAPCLPQAAPCSPRAGLGEQVRRSSLCQEAVEAAGDEVVDEEEDDEEEGDDVEVEAGVVDDVEDESDLLSEEVAGVAGLSALTLPERESLR